MNMKVINIVLREDGAVRVLLPEGITQDQIIKGLVGLLTEAKALPSSIQWDFEKEGPWMGFEN